MSTNNHQLQQPLNTITELLLHLSVSFTSVIFTSSVSSGYILTSAVRVDVVLVVAILCVDFRPILQSFPVPSTCSVRV